MHVFRRLLQLREGQYIRPGFFSPRGVHIQQQGTVALNNQGVIRSAPLWIPGIKNHNHIIIEKMHGKFYGFRKKYSDSELKINNLALKSNLRFSEVCCSHAVVVLRGLIPF
jgi:hypothetical protein